MDAHSKPSPKTVSSTSSLRFEYNATSSSKTVSLGSAYIDILGISFPTSVTLAPYTSAVLILSSGTTKAVTNTTEVVEPNSLNPSAPAFTIYPNPVKSNATLQVNNIYTGKMNIQIISETGAVVHSLSLSKDQQNNLLVLPTNDLPPGVYFVLAQVGTWTDKRKFVKL